MKTLFFKILPLLFCITVLLSCEDEDERKVFPHSVPVIESADISSLNISNPDYIIVGDSVEFRAVLKDGRTPLSTLTFKLVMQNRLIINEKIRTAGQETAIVKRFKIPFIAEFKDAIPEIFLTLENVEGDTIQKKLSDDENILVKRPVLNSKLYVVTEDNVIIELRRSVENENIYVSDELDIKGGTIRYKIAEKLTADNEIDFSGFVWGDVENEIGILENETDLSLVINEAKTSRIKKFTFDSYLFTNDIEVDRTIKLRINDKELVLSNIADYAKVDLDLTQGQEVVFEGFEDIKKIINPDFFTYVFEDIAKFEGLSGSYSLYYHTSNMFLYIEQTGAVYPDAMWICGVGMGFPKATFATTTKWDWQQPSDYIFCRKISNGVFEATFYGDSFDVKFFHQRTWGGEEVSNQYTLTPADLLKAGEQNGSPNGNWQAGTAFTKGVYKIKIDVNAKTTHLEKVNQ